jgi:hypothetical protein
MSGSPVFLPPFLMQRINIDDPRELASQALLNPHPTDVLLDTSIFAVGRLPWCPESHRRGSGGFTVVVIQEAAEP